MRFIARIAVVLLLVLSLGLHWAFLQTVAWAGMLIRYSQQGTFAEAVSQTFDGGHPCKMCRFVEAGRAQEHQPEPQTAKPGLKLEPGLVWREAVILPVSPRAWICSAERSAPARADEPAKPRPRIASLLPVTSA